VTPETREIEQTLRIAARPETVWRYWTDPGRQTAWWGVAAELDPRPGGIYLVEMEGGSVMRGAYVELVPYERIVFTFGWEASDLVPDLAPGSTRVEVTLVDDGGDTVLTLRHRGLPARLGGVHRAGWSAILPGLAAAAADRGTP
jgi:uncharacterized protein YndB with AHSA1/START domain